MKGRFRLLAVAATTFVAAQSYAYVPLLDEVEGVQANKGHYLILPAWENLDPNQKQHGYFIIPKFLVIGGNVSSAQPEYQFGVSHRGYSLFPNGSGDYPPSMDLLATVETYKDDAQIDAIQKELITRDLKAGLQTPVFPDPVFSKFEGTAVMGGVASPTALSTVHGGYPGQLTLVHVTPPPDAQPSLILDLPATAGRDAAVWGVEFKGTMPGYGNRLDCTITINHHKVYDHFKARASGQAYWGLVKADIGYEMKQMDQDQSIDFGKCRGSAEQIEKLAMPIWMKIIELGDQDGTRMFADMVKSLNGVPNHPEAGAAGWGFQASAGWEKVDYKDHTTINFNIAFRMDWQMPMAMAFSTTCNKWAKYFINNTDSSKACVPSADFPVVRDKSRACFKQYLADIAQYPVAVQPGAFKRLREMGCAWDGSWSAAPFSMASTQTPEDARSGRLCRQALVGLVGDWNKKAYLSSDTEASLLDDVSVQGCAWRGGLRLMEVHSPTAHDDLTRTLEGVRVKLREKTPDPPKR